MREPRLDGGTQVVAAGVAVPCGDDDPGAGEETGGLDGAGEFGGERDHAEHVAVPQEQVDVGERRGTEHGRVVRAALRGRQEGALQVQAEQLRATLGGTVHGGERGQQLGQPFHGRRHQRRLHTGDPLPRQPAQHLGGLPGARVETGAREPVHMQIDQPGRDQPPTQVDHPVGVVARMRRQ